MSSPPINGSPRATILVPAYNEASVIGRTLEQLQTGMEAGEFQIIVIANACHDNTAEVAALAAPEALIIETETPGKTNALRLGLAKSRAGVNVFLDADLGIDAAAIRRLISPLENGSAVASFGRMDVNLQGCNLGVRGFYAAWSHNPYLKNGKFGGLFAVSATGCERFMPLPDLTADDEYISRQFGVDEKTFVRDVEFEVRAPKTLRDLFKIRRRSLRGTREIEAMGVANNSVTGGKSVIRQLATRPKLWPAALVYGGMMLAVRAVLAFENPNTAVRWERDESTRKYPMIKA